MLLQCYVQIIWWKLDFFFISPYNMYPVLTIFWLFHPTFQFLLKEPSSSQENRHELFPKPIAKWVKCCLCGEEMSEPNWGNAPKRLQEGGSALLQGLCPPRGPSLHSFLFNCYWNTTSQHKGSQDVTRSSVKELPSTVLILLPFPVSYL